MGLPWIRLDTSLADHPKVLELVDSGQYRAAFAGVMAMTYSGKHGTDGFIPKGALPFIHARKADADKLVEVGMWDVAAGGWEIHGWDEYQLSDEESKARKQRAKKGGCIKNHGIDCGCWRL